MFVILYAQSRDCEEFLEIKIIDAELDHWVRRRIYQSINSRVFPNSWKNAQLFSQTVYIVYYLPTGDVGHWN